MSKHLFLFTISPVQSFIAQARKTQDLYAGSRILSELIKEGMHVDLFKPEEIIFPRSRDAESAPNRLRTEEVSAPNRFIALVEKPVDELKAFGEKVEKRVRKRFMDMAEETLQAEGLSKPPGFDEQIKKHLTLHWSFQPYNESNYAASYIALEDAIGSIKNIRPFEQFNYNGQLGEKGRKCSLDGERNALFSERSISKKQSKDKFNDKEELSAVGFLKRFGQWRDETAKSFPSTAEVALMYDIGQLSSKQKKCLDALEGLHHSSDKKVYAACLEMVNEKTLEPDDLNGLSSEKINGRWKTQFDYQACFEENLVEKYYPDVRQRALLKKVQRNLKTGLDTRYYALVMFDGDEMGRHLEFVAKKGLSEHTDFSKRLSAFAAEARRYVDENNYGRTVYAGGDDFLGFINLYHLFDVMEHFRTLFEKTVGSDLHFSAGIVIAHYKIQLSEVLKQVRKMERTAKDIGDRNAFCITAIRHSGEIQQAVFKWGGNNRNWGALRYLVAAVRKKSGKEPAFSTKFIQSLTLEIGRLGGMNGAFTNDGIVETEVGRLVGRSRNKNATETDVRQLVQAVMTLWSAFYEVQHQGVDRVQNFIHALHIADFISRKTNNNENTH